MRYSNDIFFEHGELDKVESAVKMKIEEEFMVDIENFSYWLSVLHILMKDPYIFWDSEKGMFHIKAPDPNGVNPILDIEEMCFPINLN